MIYTYDLSELQFGLFFYFISLLIFIIFISILFYVVLAIDDVTHWNPSPLSYHYRYPTMNDLTLDFEALVTVIGTYISYAYICIYLEIYTLYIAFYIYSTE